MIALARVAVGPVARGEWQVRRVVVGVAGVAGLLLVAVTGDALQRHAVVDLPFHRHTEEQVLEAELDGNVGGDLVVFFPGGGTRAGVGIHL